MNNRCCKLTNSEIRDLFTYGDDHYKAMSMKACVGNPEAPADIIAAGCMMNNSEIKKIAYSACVNREDDIPAIIIKHGIKDSDSTVRYYALFACRHRDDIPADMICTAMKDSDSDVRYAALMASVGRIDIPGDIICHCMLHDGASDVKLAAALALKGRSNIPANIIIECIHATKPDAFSMMHELFELCKGRSDIDKHTIIDYGFNSGNEYVRVGALIAAIGRDDMQDDIYEYFGNGLVYSACEGDVMVEAYIPIYAKATYLEYDLVYRYDMAIITKVKGLICGMNVGISTYNNEAIYRLGDVVRPKHNLFYSVELASTCCLVSGEI